MASGHCYGEQQVEPTLLRIAWFNLDWLWAGALLLTGLVLLFG